MTFKPHLLTVLMVLFCTCEVAESTVEYNKEPMPEVGVASYQDQAESFFGAPGVAQPLAPLDLPQHPYLAPAGRAGMHGDGYASGTHPAAGPLGHNPVIRSAKMGDLAGELAGDVGRLPAGHPGTAHAARGAASA